MAKVGVVVPAAGQGVRMGTIVQKQYLELAGTPILSHTLKVLANSPTVSELALVCPPGDEEYCLNRIVTPLRAQKKINIVSGGKERQESVFNGLLALSADTDIAVIHDGARPLLQEEELLAVVAVAIEDAAATLGIPVQDTVKQVDERRWVQRTLPREHLWLIQTPQAFRYDLIMKAHRQARQTGFRGTDDASLVEALGEPVRVVTGSFTNLKITTPKDLLLAEKLLQCTP